MYSIDGDDMDAYVDLSYIFHIVTLVNLPYYFKKILNVKMNKMELFTLFIFSIVLYFNVFLFFNYKYLNLVFLFGYFFIVYKKCFLKYLLLYLLVYYANISTVMLFSDHIYLLNGLVMLNNGLSFFWILSEILNILIIEIIMFSIKSIKLLKNYKINVEIAIDDEIIKCSGYIDSGNTLTIDTFPVIFLKEKYFTKKEYKQVLIKGIGTKNCKCFKTLIFINGQAKEVICASGSNEGFKGCDCLINIHLLKENENETIE